MIEREETVAYEMPFTVDFTTDIHNEFNVAMLVSTHPSLDDGTPQNSIMLIDKDNEGNDILVLSRNVKPVSLFEALTEIKRLNSQGNHKYILSAIAREEFTVDPDFEFNENTTYEEVRNASHEYVMKARKEFEKEIKKKSKDYEIERLNKKIIDLERMNEALKLDVLSLNDKLNKEPA